VSQQMSGNAEETATQANVVSAAASKCRRTSLRWLLPPSRMQSSIREIAKKRQRVGPVAKNASACAHTTNDTVKKLGESQSGDRQRDQGDYLDAQQTNLLALNATIEAARARRSGKGFRRGGHGRQGTRQTDRQKPPRMIVKRIDGDFRAIPRRRQGDRGDRHHYSPD